MRTARQYDTQRTVISDVTGNMTAWFLRTEVAVDRIGGVIDIRNEYGDTKLEFDKLLDATLSHRIISESGAIEISGTRDVVEAVPTYAHTLCGTIHSNIPREVLDQFNFQIGRALLVVYGHHVAAGDDAGIAGYRAIVNEVIYPGCQTMVIPGSVAAEIESRSYADIGEFIVRVANSYAELSTSDIRRAYFA